MPVARFQFVWSAINHMALFFPSAVFTMTQAVSDFFVPLLDDGVIGTNTILAVMFSTGFLLACTSAAVLMSLYTLFQIFWGNGPICESFIHIIHIIHKGSLAL